LIARRYLEHCGYQVLEQNYRFGKKGEIDIIARDGEYLVFCEVKSRESDEFGPPEYALTKHKQSQVRRIAHAYLYLRKIKDQACRFDVVAIRFEGKRPVLRLLKNAF